MKQILIVEDDSFLNKMLDYNLTADGYGVTSALNARTAADAIRHREFDLVLLDINLPDGNGFELCKLIKPQHPDTIVIFLTANDQESDQIRGYEIRVRYSSGQASQNSLAKQYGVSRQTVSAIIQIGRASCRERV